MASIDMKVLQKAMIKRMAEVPPLEDEPDFFMNPTVISQFLKARNYNLNDAEELLRATVKWRREKKPLSVDCKCCHFRPGAHSLRQVGHDECCRPVIYSCFSQSETRENVTEDVLNHVIYAVENAKRSMEAGVHGWVFVIDCTGMSLPACNPRLGAGIGTILANHYPEHLALVICVNHNAIFKGVWRAISIIFHPNTIRKVNFLPTDTKMADLFSMYFSEELTTWFMNEIALNRKHPLIPSQRHFWEKPADGLHDPRGCPSYIRDYVESSKGHHKPHPNIVDSLSRLNVARATCSENPIDTAGDGDDFVDVDIGDAEEAHCSDMGS